MNTKKILFHENQITERGTSISLYDYAYFARELLDIEPIITFDSTLQANNTAVLSKFQKEFKIIPYDNFSQVDRIIEQYKIDYFYAIKYGTNDNIVASNATNLIHSVFSRDESQIHGDIYAVISEWLCMASEYTMPFVPHMLNLPNHDVNLRQQLGIPENAIVIGRYGAIETFNIDFVNGVISDILNTRKDIWFLFVNTDNKINHSRCLYLKPIIDLGDKVKFINTCDAMLHARDYGETFGLSVLEFAAKNKQIISYDNEVFQMSHPLGGRNHFLFLQDNCFKYQNKKDLKYILLNITKETPFNTLYLNEQFSPKNVMDKFQDVFLSNKIYNKFVKFTNQHYPLCEEMVNTYKEYIENKTILDIGSNIGLFSKAIINNVPYSHIHLFEPSIEYFNKSKSYLKDIPNITFNNVGLSDTNESVILYKSKDSNIGWNTICSQDPIQGEGFIDRMKSESVRVIRLDDYYKDITTIDFIKIDVEGFERHVLEGAWELIKKFKPYMLIELSWGINHPEWKLNKSTYEKLFSLGYEEVDFSLIHDTCDILFKPINYNKLPISIGILSWKSNKSLKNSLESYKQNGLFEVVNDITLFFQECTEENIKLANEYNIPYIAFNKNIGIGGAFVKLAQIAETDNILLLEDDWELVETKNNIYTQLKTGLKLLNRYDCIRYRHRQYPGYPLYSKNVYENNELNHYDTVIDLVSPHLIECCHWKDNLDIIFSNKIQKELDFYTTTSRWSSFSNNPCMYKKEFYITNVSPFINKGMLLENDISYWWSRQNFKIAWGQGLFTHNDLDNYITEARETNENIT